MKITLRGVRGSIPTTHPLMAYYGGNTSCAVVEEQGWLLILDAGSGMQQIRAQPDASIQRVDVLLTHLHLDHILGLGFFGLFFNPDLDVHIWGPAGTSSLHARLSRYLSPPLFPVLLRDLPCTLSLHEVGNSEWNIGPFDIRSDFVIHPGPTVGYRVSNGRSVFTYIPDHEPALGAKGLIPDPHWLSGYELAAGADLLLHDAQYSREEYPSRLGWGHSSMDDALQFAEIAGAKKLLLAHHDPSHTDEQLTAMHEGLLLRARPALVCELAIEGKEFMLP